MRIVVATVTAGGGHLAAAALGDLFKTAAAAKAKGLVRDKLTL